MNQARFTCLIFLGTILLSGCNLPGVSAPRETPAGMLETPISGQGESTLSGPDTTPLPVNMIAFYPLTSDFLDLTGNNTPATATFVSLSADGVFCNVFCDLTTPALNGFNRDAFTIRVEFLEPKYPVFRDTVFVAGDYRWTKFVLLPDGSVALGYNNDETVCSVKYQTNVWHEAVITYDGVNLKLYLDGTEGCSVSTPLTTGGSNLITLRDYGWGSSFIGVAKNLQVYNNVEVPLVRTPQPGNVTLTDATLSPADVILSSCPSESDLAAIDADLSLSFEADPRAVELVCTASAGSRDLTGFKRIIYTTLLVMKNLEFNQSLPWTDLQLYTWFVNTVQGIRFRSDIEYSSCCSPAGVINIQVGNLSVNFTDKWIDLQLGSGVKGLLVLFVHEARHNEFGGHTCGSNDNTRAEMGAWGVQYYLETYLANNLVDPSFLTIPIPSLASYYSDIALYDANMILSSNFCMDH